MHPERKRLVVLAGGWILAIWVAAGTVWAVCQRWQPVEEEEVEVAPGAEKETEETPPSEGGLTADERRYFRRAFRDGARLLVRRLEEMPAEERMPFLGSVMGMWGPLAAGQPGAGRPALHPEIGRIFGREFLGVLTSPETSEELRAQLAPLLERLRPGEDGGEGGEGL